MVGRDLCLPCGEHTEDRAVDAVMLTVHDKFDDILAEAQHGNSIAGCHYAVIVWHAVK